MRLKGKPACHALLHPGISIALRYCVGKHIYNIQGERERCCYDPFPPGERERCCYDPLHPGVEGTTIYTLVISRKGEREQRYKERLLQGAYRWSVFAGKVLRCQPSSKGSRAHPSCFIPAGERPSSPLLSPEKKAPAASRNSAAANKRDLSSSFRPL